MLDFLLDEDADNIATFVGECNEGKSVSVSVHGDGWTNAVKVTAETDKHGRISVDVYVCTATVDIATPPSALPTKVENTIPGKVYAPSPGSTITNIGQVMRLPGKKGDFYPFATMDYQFYEASGDDEVTECS